MRTTYQPIRSYEPPGPPHDPWGPYIREAAERFDVPEVWIREVMRVESGGRWEAISPAGAMGLMQVMPATYESLRVAHGLGDDPFHPRDNILAGAAYLREMYDRFGRPGMLAAYNAGPGTFERYLNGQRGLPDETRRYVAAIAPRIRHASPRNPAPPEVYRMAAIPETIPPGPRRFGAPTQLAWSAPTPPAPPARAPAPVTAPLREPAVAQVVPRSPTPPAPVLAAAPAPAHASGGFRLVSQAVAAPAAPAARPATLQGAWAIQVGAFQRDSIARAAIEDARRAAPDLLAAARPVTTAVRTSSGTLVRARLAGLSQDAAVAACRALARRGQACVALAPDAQG
ncbi:MAG: lytic transglycosylase domain-containing protein [Acetobacteraceae bacterium]|nr:lytic transglycosylase domain-containing protein [Acetobacteraceae bacterium]